MNTDIRPSCDQMIMSTMMRTGVSLVNRASSVLVEMVRTVVDTAQSVDVVLHRVHYIVRNRVSYIVWGRVSHISDW